MPSKVTTVTIGKGGVGKTTLASALAAYYALRGEKTLYIEVDYSTRAWFTLIPAEVRGATLDDAKTAYNFFRNPGAPLDARLFTTDATYTIDLEALFARGVGTAQEIRDAHYHHRWTTPAPLDMIPGTPRLRFADDDLLLLSRDPQAKYNPLLVFRDRLAPLRERFARIVIDMPPTLEHLFKAVLAGSDDVVVPLGLDPASPFEFTQCFDKFRETHQALKRLGEPTPRLAGVAVNFYDDRLAPHRERLAKYRTGSLGVPVLGVVPQDATTLSLAMEAAQTVVTFAPAAPITEAIIQLAKTLEEVAA